MNLEIIHDGPRYQVVHQRAASAITVIGFEHWQAEPSRKRASSSAAFFGRCGIDFIGVQPVRNDWFQDDEMLDAIAAIRAVTPHAKRVGFGASMGGFGVLAFAEDLGLASVVALAPQFSIQPARVPFEHRWRQFAPEIDFRHDKIDRIAPIRAGYVMYDPAHIDREHVRLIRARHPLQPVPVYFAGHEPGILLARAGIFGSVLLSLIEGRFNRAAYARQLRMVRPRINLAWVGVARALLQRGAVERAAAAMERARALPPPMPNPFAADLVRAEIFRRLGDHAASDAVLAPYLADVGSATFIRWYRENPDPARLDFV